MKNALQNMHLQMAITRVISRSRDKEAFKSIPMGRLLFTTKPEPNIKLSEIAANVVAENTLMTFDLNFIIKISTATTTPRKIINGCVSPAIRKPTIKRTVEKSTKKASRPIWMRSSRSPRAVRQLHTTSKWPIPLTPLCPRAALLFPTAHILIASLLIVFTRHGSKLITLLNSTKSLSISTNKRVTKIKLHHSKKKRKSILTFSSRQCAMDRITARCAPILRRIPSSTLLVLSRV